MPNLGPPFSAYCQCPGGDALLGTPGRLDPLAVSVAVGVGAALESASAIMAVGAGSVDVGASIMTSRGAVAPEKPTNAKVLMPTTATATTTAKPARRARGSAEGEPSSMAIRYRTTTDLRDPGLECMGCGHDGWSGLIGLRCPRPVG